MRLLIKYRDGKINIEGSPTNEERKIYESIEGICGNFQEPFRQGNSELDCLLAIGNFYKAIRDFTREANDFEIEGILDIRVKKGVV